MYIKEDNVYLIQIDTPHYQWEFEDAFSLGGECKRFIPGMIRAFMSNADNGIIENYYCEYDIISRMFNSPFASSGAILQ